LNLGHRKGIRGIREGGNGKLGGDGFREEGRYG